MKRINILLVFVLPIILLTTITDGVADSQPEPEGMFSNPSPSNNATNVWLNTNLAFNWMGKASSFDFYFEQNHTTDGRWAQIGDAVQATSPNCTVKCPFSCLDWGKTYYWRVRAVNKTGGQNYSSPTYHFTTLYNGTEPDTIHFYQGAQINIVSEVPIPPDPHQISDNDEKKHPTPADKLEINIALAGLLATFGGILFPLLLGASSLSDWRRAL